MNNPFQTNATQENTNKQEEKLKDYLKKMEIWERRAEEGKKRVENALKAKMLDEAKKHAQLTSRFAYEVLRIADSAEKVTSEQNTENKKRLKELKKKINECAQNAQILAYETDKLILDEERYKITFDKLSTLWPFLFKLGLLIGGGCIFIYCFFYINYLPSDVGIGNAFAFIFIALGFGIGYVLIIGFLIVLIIGYSIIFNFLLGVVHKIHEWLKIVQDIFRKLFRKVINFVISGEVEQRIRSKIHEWLKMVQDIFRKLFRKVIDFVIQKEVEQRIRSKIHKWLKKMQDVFRKSCRKIIKLFIFVLIIAFLIKDFSAAQGLQLSLYSLLELLGLIIISMMIIEAFQGGFLLDECHSSKARFILGVFFVIIQFMLISQFSKLTGIDFVRNSINNLGIARQNVSMALSEKDFNLIKNTAKEADMPVLFSCNENEKTIHGVNVLWHGLGDNTLIEIPSKEQNKNIRLELKSSDNKIITLGNQISAKGCIHARLKNSFDKGKSEPSEEMTNELNDILKKVANNYDVKKLDVTGYADLSPYKGGNQQLSKQRADAVKSKIDEMKNGIQEIRNLEVYSIGGGNYHADNKCNNPKLSEKDLEDCRMVDRGISLRFHVEQKKTNQGNQQDAQSKQQNN